MAFNLVVTLAISFCINSLSQSFECTQAQIQKIVEANVLANSNCPKRDWIPNIMLKELQYRPSITMVYVGCNKADDFISLMYSFSGDKVYDISKHNKILTDKYRAYWACGVSQPTPTLQDFTRVTTGYCIEPMKSTYDMITDISNQLNYDRSSVHLIRAAVSSRPGHTYFPINIKNGTENIGLSRVERNVSKSIKTRIITIDTLVEHHHINTIDFLSIDAEGYDGQVIMGMLKTLSTKTIRYIEFEYHKMGQWKYGDLLSILQLLDYHNFDCFWQGNTGQLWRATGCWHDSYYTKRYWSNLVCVNRHYEQKAHQMFITLSQSYM